MSPGRDSIENASTSTSGSVPSARVITERCGCTSASAGDSSPRRTSSATSEWSSVSCSRRFVAEEVRARVADVTDRNERRRGRRARRSSSFPSRRRPRRSSRARARAGLLPGSARSTRLSPPPLASLSFSAAAASADATSPACAPPMPSAIANSGGWQTNASSFRRRLRPGSVAACACAILTARTSGRSRRFARRRPARACARGSAGSRSRRCRSSSRCPRPRRRRVAARTGRVGSRRTRRPGERCRCSTHGRSSADASRSRRRHPARARGSRATTSRPSSRAEGCARRPAAAACCGARIIDS